MDRHPKRCQLHGPLYDEEQRMVDENYQEISFESITGPNENPSVGASSDFLFGKI